MDKSKLILTDAPINHFAAAIQFSLSLSLVEKPVNHAGCRLPIYFQLRPPPISNILVALLAAAE